jgi:hypothetical protein
LQPAMFVEARHRIVEDNHLVGALQVLIQGRQEKGKCERVAVAGAESCLERMTPGRRRPRPDRNLVAVYY